MNTEERLEDASRDDAGWMLILFLLAPICVLQFIDPFSIALISIVTPVSFFALLTMLAAFYRRWRPAPQIVGMLAALQQMILFTALGSVLSYMLAAQGGAFWDASLHQWDRALGLDWLAYLQFVNAHPWLGTLYRLSYQSLIPQMVVLIVGLGFARKLRELRIVMMGAMLAGVVTVLISGLTPAVSNFPFHGVAPELYANLRPSAAFVHVSDLEGLRSGTLRSLWLNRMEGIITFPSYHAALATVFVWGFWRLPFARWPGVAVAALTILATPIDGGHYFVDVFAGIAIAAAALWFSTHAVFFDAAKRLARSSPVPAAQAVFRSLPFRHSRGASGR